MCWKNGAVCPNCKNVDALNLSILTGENLKKAMLDCVKVTAIFNSNESLSYLSIQREFAERQRVNHKIDEFVGENSYFNTCESIHALLKRGIIGIFHHITKQHLYRYLGEFDFRFNARKNSDGERTLQTIQGFEGKCLMDKTSSQKEA